MDVFASGGGLDGPFGLDFGPEGMLYVASYNSDQILRRNGTTGAPIDSIQGGGLDGPTFFEFPEPAAGALLLLVFGMRRPRFQRT